MHKDTTVKLTTAQLRSLIKEVVEEENSLDDDEDLWPTDPKFVEAFKEAQWKMDKYMPDDPRLMRRFNKAVKEKDIYEVTSILEEESDYDRLMRYLPRDEYIVNEFANWLCQQGSQ